MSTATPFDDAPSSQENTSSETSHKNRIELISDPPKEKPCDKICGGQETSFWPSNNAGSGADLASPQGRVGFLQKVPWWLGPPRFAPLLVTEIVSKNGVTQATQCNIQVITAMRAYQHKSVEELRYEDYARGNKTGQAACGIGGTYGGGMGLGGGLGPQPTFSSPFSAGLLGLQQAATTCPSDATVSVLGKSLQVPRQGYPFSCFNIGSPSLANKGFGPVDIKAAPTRRRILKSNVSSTKSPEIPATAGGNSLDEEPFPFGTASTISAMGPMSRKEERTMLLDQLASLQKQQEKLMARLRELDDGDDDPNHHDEWDVSKVGKMLSGIDVFGGLSGEEFKCANMSGSSSGVSSTAASASPFCLGTSSPEATSSDGAEQKSPTFRIGSADRTWVAKRRVLIPKRW